MHGPGSGKPHLASHTYLGRICWQGLASMSLVCTHVCHTGIEAPQNWQHAHVGLEFPPPRARAPPQRWGSLMPASLQEREVGACPIRNRHPRTPALPF